MKIPLPRTHRWLMACLVCLALDACQTQPARTHSQSPTQGATTPEPQSLAAPGSATAQPSGQDTAMLHDPAHPPIDCPLRKQGINPNHLRPFEDVEKYIAFLERPDRAVWQKPAAVVAALGLTGSEHVVDLGAGSGYFAFRFARALPQGQVLAADIEAEMVRHMHHKSMTDDVKNVTVQLVQPDEPAAAVDEDTDLVFICDVFHHVPARAAWLSQIVDAMGSGARLVMIEFKQGELPKGPPAAIKISHAALIQLALETGLTLVQDDPELLPYQTFLVFKKL